MILNEYLRFMQTLAGANVPDGVSKVANLVLDHFDVIQPLGTNQGQRVRKIVQLTQVHWQTLATLRHAQKLHHQSLFLPQGRHSLYRKQIALYPVSQL